MLLGGDLGHNATHMLEILRRQPLNGCIVNQVVRN